MKSKFRRRYTKWIPLGNHKFHSYDYVTFVRKNLNTGMLQFKTKRVNGYFAALGCLHTFLPSDLIDTQKAWDEINQQQ